MVILKYLKRILGYFIGNVPEIEKSIKSGKLFLDLYLEWFDKCSNNDLMYFKIGIKVLFIFKA